MEITKKIGVWLDHSTAHVVALTADPLETKIVASKFTHGSKEKSLSKSENIMHNKEKHQQSEYYKELGEIIKDYDDVILFGPTTAKAELANILNDDHRFEKIRIHTKQADKMSDTEMHSYVRDYFSKR